MASPRLDAFLADLVRSGRDVHLLAGAAVLAAYGGQRCEPELEVPQAEAALAPEGSELHRKHGLCLRPAAALLPADWKKRRVKAAPGIYVPSREDLAVSLAARYHDADRQDLAVLLGQDCDRLALIRLFRAARRLYKGDLRVLDRAFNAVLREFLGLGPFRF
jgi:hypothetical protein